MELTWPSNLKGNNPPYPQFPPNVSLYTFLFINQSKYSKTLKGVHSSGKLCLSALMHLYN